VTLFEQRPAGDLMTVLNPEAPVDDPSPRHERSRYGLGNEVDRDAEAFLRDAWGCRTRTWLRTV